MSSTLAPDVTALEQPQKVLELDEVFREFRDSVAWKQLHAFLDGEWLRAVRVGLDAHETPARVSHLAGYVDALAFLRDLPTEVARRAKLLKDTKQEQEKADAETAAERRIPRHTISG